MQLWRHHWNLWWSNWSLPNEWMQTWNTESPLQWKNWLAWPRLPDWYVWQRLVMLPHALEWGQMIKPQSYKIGLLTSSSTWLCPTAIASERVMTYFLLITSSVIKNLSTGVGRHISSGKPTCAGSFHILSIESICLLAFERMNYTCISRLNIALSNFRYYLPCSPRVQNFRLSKLCVCCSLELVTFSCLVSWSSKSLFDSSDKYRQVWYKFVHDMKLTACKMTQNLDKWTQNESPEK